MKSLSLLFSIIITFALYSCKTTKEFYKDFNAESLTGREPNADVFIVKKDGTKISGHQLTHSKTSAFNTNEQKEWTAVDGQKVIDKEIEVVQSEKAYSALYRRKRDKAEWMVDRLRYGKISLYTYEETATDHDVRGNYHLYVYQKGNESLDEVTFNNLMNAVSDNPVASQKLKELYPNSKIPLHNEKGNLRNLIAIVELYNTK